MYTKTIEPIYFCCYPYQEVSMMFPISVRKFHYTLSIVKVSRTRIYYAFFIYCQGEKRKILRKSQVDGI